MTNCSKCDKLIEDNTSFCVNCGIPCLSVVKEAQEHSIWDFGNQILYDMCEKTPLHINDDEIVGKVWLIGRSYSVAIERRKKYIGDKYFYETHLVPAINKIANELDDAITRLKAEEKITDEIIPKIFELHKLICDALYDITDLQKRSFASKYLHFHLPKLFYIYDSIAKTNFKKCNILKKDISKNKPVGYKFDDD